MKARELVDQIEPDHQFVVKITESSATFRSDDDRVIHRFTCTCGYTGAYVSTMEFTITWPEVAQERANLWLQNEHLEHLLDQDVEL